MAKGFREFPPQVVPATVWQGRKAAMRSRGVPDDDPRIVECDEWMAYHRVLRAIQAESGQLSREGVDLLGVALADRLVSS